jgi:gamma-glutamyltranspeptidase/glutathione hydrolase
MRYFTVNFKPRRCFALALALACAASSYIPARAEMGRGQRGIVASVDPLATQAGIDAMKSGGNAIDAAVAVALTLGVVDGHNSGIGGGCFMLIRRANGQIIALDGREEAPAAATRAMYIRDGKGDTALSQTGALASGIPGSVAVYERAVQNYGKKSFAEALLPAAKIAEDGFALDAGDASRLASVAATMKRFPATASIYLKADGEPLGAGEILRQPDLARSYRALAAQGSKWFYGGAFAAAAGAWMKANGGIITARDFALYTMKLRAPIASTYRGYQIVSFPPPSSGGVHVAQILNILKRYNLALLAPADREQAIAESMKLAFADRAFWLGDPDFVDVPRGLVSENYARSLAAKISLDKATKVESHGDPLPFDKSVFEKHTTHFSTADAEGNWVACTATVNTTFGSKVVVPGTGIVLNNQMDDFSIQPGVANAFKLIGAEANAIAPGKRPLSSMSPTIVLRNGQPILSLGAAGGPTIITQTVQNIIGVLDLHLPLDEALAQPRIHQQWVPDELRIEKSLPQVLKDSLRARGHVLDEVTGIGAAQMVGVDPNGPGFVGASDPRVEGLALGW